MQEIDADMASSEIPVIGRELFAIKLICNRFGFSLAFQESLATRIFKWVRVRYGDRLNVDWSFVMPVMVGSDIYRLRSPVFVMGQIVCVPARIEPTLNSSVVNVLDLIEELSDGRKRELFNDDLARIRRDFLEFYELYHLVSKVRNEQGFIEGFGDLQTASDVLFQSRPQLGSSRWASLQAAEKFLKAWLGRKGSSGWGHDLARLTQDAEALGLPVGMDIATVQCRPDVRYNASGISSNDAVNALYGAHRICGHVVKHL